MGLGRKIENLSSDAQEYLKRSLDDYKMGVVEEVSLMAGGFLAATALFLILFAAFLFMLIAVVALLANVIGFAGAMLVAGGVLAVAAAVLYCMRTQIFVNSAVRHLSRLFALRKEDSNE